MRVPLSWLREFAPIAGSIAEITDALNNLGLIVDGIDAPGRDISGVIAARVVEVNDHPNADKLTLVDIDTGSSQTTVVCGAHNNAPGDIVPYAPAGATLPGGFTLERRKIRGITSDGMLCSARELGLGDDHAGILHLPEATELGVDVREVLGLDDTVFDLDITPNRPDAMSVVGVARDLAAAFGVPFAIPDPAADGAAPVAAASLVVEASDRCPRYVARTGTVRVGPSPAWLARRLVQCGVRPISNVVDVTNYVMLELGQPMHAFDLALLGGRGIVVRMADDGETITTLDDVERTLTTEDLLICDAERVPHAIAGIMGGSAAEVSDATTEVLLESAYFTPIGIGRTSKRLGLRSESSARFERGVDPNGTLRAATRAWQLFEQVADGVASPDPLDAYPQPVTPARIHVRAARVNALLGTDLATDAIAGYLAPLELAATADGDGLDVVVPTFRPDIEREIDVVEEVARHHGYNKIERRVARSVSGGGLTPLQRERRLVRDVLSGAGLFEAWTLSLIGGSDLEKAGLPAEGVEIENPLRAEERLLRPALLPGLLGAAAFNAGHGISDVALFEVGHVFLPPTDQTGVLPDERDHAAAMLTGTVTRRPHEVNRPVDPYDASAIWHALADALGLADARIEPATAPTFHPTRCAAIVIDGATVGYVGEIDPTVRANFGLDVVAVGLEVHLDAVLAAKRRDSSYASPSRFPASTFDLAFVLADDVPAGRVTQTLLRIADELIEDVRVFDVFRSDALGPGKRSVAYALRLRAPDRTLTDAEVGDVRSRCIDAVTREHAAELRG